MLSQSSALVRPVAPRLLHKTKATLQILSGQSHPELANSISKILSTEPVPVHLSKFSNRESHVKLLHSVRKKNIYIIQAPSENVNDDFMELLLMVSACKQNYAGTISAVVPCFPYARADKRGVSRSPISAKLIAQMLETAGADEIITMELHASQIQGFFDIPIRNLDTVDVMSAWLKSLDRTDIVLVSPDAGGMKRVTKLAEVNNLPFALIHKERKVDNQVSRMTLVGDVRDQLAVIVDDMVDTCGTLITAAEKLSEAGASGVMAIMTHGVLSGPALNRIMAADCLSGLVVTNSMCQVKNVENCPKLTVLDISASFAAAIQHSFEPVPTEADV